MHALFIHHFLFMRCINTERLAFCQCPYQNAMVTVSSGSLCDGCIRLLQSRIQGHWEDEQIRKKHQLCPSHLFSLAVCLTVAHARTFSFLPSLQIGFKHASSFYSLWVEAHVLVGTSLMPQISECPKGNKILFPIVKIVFWDYFICRYVLVLQFSIHIKVYCC